MLRCKDCYFLHRLVLFFFFFIQTRNYEVSIIIETIRFERCVRLNLLTSLKKGDSFAMIRRFCWNLRILIFFKKETNRILFFLKNIGHETTKASWRRSMTEKKVRGEGERRREISRWHNQWTIRPVDSINPCYGAGLRVATTLTINSTELMWTVDTVPRG